MKLETMLLAIDIGNSSIKFGVFDGDKLTAKFSIPTKRGYSPGEIAECTSGRLALPIDEAIACSVVPEVEVAISRFVNDLLHTKARFVRSTDDLGLKVKFNIETTGADRLVNAFAAAKMYGVPCVVVSFGTATTIDVVNAECEYLGGLIAPGMKVAAQALSLTASKLPNIEIRKPENVIAQITETAIQSGIVYGQIAMVEGLLKRVIGQLQHKPKVIATGGFAELLANEIDLVDMLDTDLTLESLQMIHRRLRKPSHLVS